MITSLAHPRAGTDHEPEPEHGRDVSNPDQMPPLPRRTAQSADPRTYPLGSTAQLAAVVRRITAHGDSARHRSYGGTL